MPDLIKFADNQCCGSRSKLNPYSGILWIRIRIPKTDPEAEGVRFKTKLHYSETQLNQNLFRLHFLQYSSKQFF